MSPPESVRQAGGRLSVCKPNYLILRIDRCLDAQGNDATGLRMSNVDIAHDGQIRVRDRVHQDLFIFLRIGFVHRLAGENAGKHIKNAGFLERKDCPSVFLGRHPFLAGFQQKYLSGPILHLREEPVLFTEKRHIGIAVSVEKVVGCVNAASEYPSRKDGISLQQFKTMIEWAFKGVPT